MTLKNKIKTKILQKKLNKKQYEAEIKFGGFYGTEHEKWLNNIEEEIKLGFPKIKLDLKKMQKQYCEDYINFLNQELELNLKFEKVYYPKTYNYETNTIQILINEKDIKQILNKTLEEEEEYFKDYIKKVTTAKSGFIPFYNQDTITDMENVDLLVTQALTIWNDIYNEEEKWYQYIIDENLEEQYYNLKFQIKKENKKKNKNVPK